MRRVAKKVDQISKAEMDNEYLVPVVVCDMLALRDISTILFLLLSAATIATVMLPNIES